MKPPQIRMKVTKSLAREAVRPDAPPSTYHSGFRRGVCRNLITSPRYGAPRIGPSLSRNFVPPEIAQLVGAADALAGRMHPPRNRSFLDGDIHPRYAVSTRQSCATPE